MQVDLDPDGEEAPIIHPSLESPQLRRLAAAVMATQDAVVKCPRPERARQDVANLSEDVNASKDGEIISTWVAGRQRLRGIASASKQVDLADRICQLVFQCDNPG